ncbi:MAG: O-antigen ligase family protein [Candidatus Omnitrophica bacterium]|nr:O-antigen ligase family protein [Candidatus Omnitrophota bacterium]
MASKIAVPLLGGPMIKIPARDRLLLFFTAVLILWRPFMAEWVYPARFVIYETILVLFLALGILFCRAGQRCVRSRFFWVWAAWVLLTGISAGFHPMSNAGRLGWMPVVLNGGFFILVTASGASRWHRLWLMAALLIGSLGAMVLASVQWSVDFPYLKNSLAMVPLSYSDKVFYQDFLNRGRILGPFFSPDLFAGYLVMIFFVSLAFLEQIERKILYVIPAALLTALFMTRSLGGWISLLAGLTVLSALSGGRRKSLNFLILLLCLGAVVLWVQRMTAGSEAGSLENSFRQRLNFWKSSWEMFCYAPFQGVGFGQFPKVYHYFQQPLAFETRYAHNIGLQLLAEFGVWGGMWLACWLGSFAAESRRLLKTPSVNSFADKALLAGLGAFFVHNLVDFSFSVPQVSDHWWIIAGLLTDVTVGAGFKPAPTKKSEPWSQ